MGWKGEGRGVGQLSVEMTSYFRSVRSRKFIKDTGLNRSCRSALELPIVSRQGLPARSLATLCGDLRRHPALEFPRAGTEDVTEWTYEGEGFPKTRHPTHFAW